jgi:hypothetical protein
MAMGDLIHIDQALFFFLIGYSKASLTFIFRCSACPKIGYVLS